MGSYWIFQNGKAEAGNIEPIIITQDKVIVSGHQRVRALKELGVAQVNAEIKIYEYEDKVLKDLIESNLRQRVLGNTNPVKLGRCFDFLNNYYGFHQGNGSNQYKQNEKLFNIAEANNFSTQKELAESYGITQQTMNNYIRMAGMIPELEDLVETGIVTKDTALAMIKIYLITNNNK